MNENYNTKKKRKLTSIQQILKLEPIKNADRIEKATVLGWSLVVLKGDFKVGDLCVYCEIDSILPEREEFEFLRERKFRIKTIKMRGCISQGIAFPISILPTDINIREGLDVTEILGIKKYEIYIPLNMRGIIKGNFPDFIEKTDEIRIQTVPNVLTRHQNKSFYITEKLDGASVSYYFNNGEFGVCSRERELKEDYSNLYWYIAKEYNLKEKLSEFGKNICIQGEIIGSKVNRNKYKLNSRQFYIFNIYDIDKHQYYNYIDFISIVKKLDLDMVPLLEESFKLPETIEDIVKVSIGKSKINPNINREGIVIRSLIEDYDEELGRLSFKVINPIHLLKNDD